MRRSANHRPQDDGPQDREDGPHVRMPLRRAVGPKPKSKAAGSGGLLALRTVLRSLGFPCGKVAADAAHAEGDHVAPSFEPRPATHDDLSCPRVFNAKRIAACSRRGSAIGI